LKNLKKQKSKKPKNQKTMNPRKTTATKDKLESQPKDAD